MPARGFLAALYSTRTTPLEEEAVMAAPHRLSPASLSWQHWSILVIVLTLVLLSALLLPGW
jgi:hypothetical protein